MTEEVFMRAWESLPKYQVGESHFSSWLYIIAYNLLVDHYRRRNPVQIPPDHLAHYADPGELPERIIGRKQECEVLAQSIIRLEDLNKQVLLLRFVEGLSHREIASIIGINQTTSRVIQHRALKALRVHLKHRGITNV